MKKRFHLHINSRAGIFKKIGMDPFADWFFILLISTVLALVFIGFGVSLFLYINSDNVAVSSANAASTAGALNKAGLTKIITTFQDKKAAEALYVSGYHNSVDPSASSTVVR